MNKPILVADCITKTLKTNPPLQILKGISLDVYPGQSIAIVGKSGSGKSTLLHILGTLDSPSTGKVLFPKAQSTNAQTLRSEHIGFVFQAFHLLEECTLLENVLMPGKIARKKLHQILPRALDLLNQMDLEDKKQTPVKFLSGGEKQRASLARALLNNPDILLVDEPTGNLDSTNAKQVQILLLDYCRKQKKSLILVTHDKEFAALCDKTFFLQEGLLSSAYSAL